ncbi:MAG: hypothetical protein ACKOPU_03380 [Candidatus Planktophila sp.]
MGALKDVVFDIQDEIRSGELSFAEIAERYEVPLSTVEDILQDMIEQEDEDYYPDYEDDGDALASAGFGMDEDYGYYGEEF